MVKTTMNAARLAIAAIAGLLITPALQVAAWNAPTHIVTGAIVAMARFRFVFKVGPRARMRMSG
jgi:hypothetical protein